MKRLGAILRSLATIALCAILPALAEAAFEDLGSGARAPGMGNAFTAVADDLNAHYYNPAGLGRLARPQFGTTYSRLYMGLSDGSNLSLTQLAYAQPLRGGQRGTLGLAYHQMSLSGLYGERSIYTSYGRKVMDSEDRGMLFAGGSLKYLTIGFEPPAEAKNACQLKQCNKGEDPVLAGDSSKSAFDLDLGLLYRFPGERYTAALAIKHLNSPNMAFSSSDSAPLARSMRLGFAYKALWMNLSSELQLDKAPGGGSDKTFLVGGERYFPTLSQGQFGLRGGLGLGSRDFRQLSTGLSYRINKMQFDYSFLMPLGTVAGTAGTHRLGMTLHFGAPTPEEQYEADLLEKIKAVEKPVVAYAYEFEDLPSPIPEALNDEKFDAIQAEMAAGRYEEAYKLLSKHLKQEAAGVALISLGHRLEEVVAFYPALDVSSGTETAVPAWSEPLKGAITDFLYGRDKSSVLKASYALSLSSSAPNLAPFVARLELVTGRQAQRLPADATLDLLELKLQESKTLFMSRNFDAVIKLGREILVLRPEDPTALSRVGSAYFVQDDFTPAIAYWQRALKTETDATERQTLTYMLGQAEKKLAALAAPKEAAKPAPKEAAAPRRAARPADPKAIERLYQYGVELYSSGDWKKAAAAFQKIVELDPENKQALRALRRLEGELMLREERP